MVSLYNVAQRTTTIALDREDRRGHIKPCQALGSAFVRASKSVCRAVYATLSVDNLGFFFECARQVP